MAELGGALHRGRPSRRPSAAVLLKVYARCIDGQADTVNKRIAEPPSAAMLPNAPDARAGHCPCPAAAAAARSAVS